MRIIVTGGSGFIGYHLAEYLSRNAGNEVTIIDNHERGEPDAMFKALTARENVIFLNRDMTQKTFYHDLTGRYDCIYHLAAINGTKNFYERPYDVMRVNILSLMNMLEWTNSDNCGGFMFTSSAYTDFFTVISKIAKQEDFDKIPRDLPLLLTSGELDPVGGKDAVEKLAADYEKLGFTDVTVQLYPEDRHEILNEVDRDKVFANILAWLVDKAEG